MASESTDDCSVAVKKTIHEMDVNELFSHFAEKAYDVGPITEAFSLLKEKLGLEERYGPELYSGLKSKLTSWKAKSLWEILDRKAKLDLYKSQSACPGTSVVIVGCGPIGMRLAIECSLLGCDVVIVEKRSYFSRNNVLHLWPFTIDDLKRLGAKKFYGSFCAGAIDHISIRTLQSILLKVSLLVGVKIYFKVEFVKILEPGGGRGWHAEFNPSNHEINRRDFKVLVGAEGKTSRIPGFDRKELRAKLALAITANFVNKHTADEAAIQEISGVAFIFNQKFFKDMREETGIDLENLVYYKDDTHYFIMTAKKESLLEKGVLKKDYNDVGQLLHPSNRDVQKLYDYSCEAADWSTDLPHLEFALNHKNLPDVDLFDFTSIYQAEYAAKCIRRGDRDLLLCLVGDSLVQPFWPQGTGCARGFLSAMDAAWMIRGIGQKRTMLELLAEREILFQRLTQTKPENLSKKFSAYTLEPWTRYPNLNLKNVNLMNAKRLYDSDGAEPLALESVPAVKENAIPPSSSNEAKNKEQVKNKPNEEAATPTVLGSPARIYRSINKKGEVNRALYGTVEDQTQLVDKEVLIQWFQEQVQDFSGLHVNDLARSFRTGLVLCAVIHRYNPELIPDFSDLNAGNPMRNNTLAFTLAENHFGIQKLLKPSEMAKPDRLALFTYLSNFYAVFKELELPDKKPPEPSLTKTPPTKPPRRSSQGRSSHYQKIIMTPPSAERSWSTQTTTSLTRRAWSSKKMTKKERKREKEAKKEKSKDSLEETPLVTKSSIKNLDSKLTTVEQSSKQERKKENESPAKKRTSSSAKTASPPPPTSPPAEKQPQGATGTSITPGARRPKAAIRPVSTFGEPSVNSDVCFFCGKRVYLMERMSANGVFFHRHCFRCSHCNTQLTLGHFAMSKGESGEPGKFFCKPHYRQLFLSNPEAINYARSQPQKKSSSPEELAVTPPSSPLPTISEYEVIPSPEPETVEDEEEHHEKKRKRRLTQRLSAIWKRRSRSKSKSASPDKQVAKEDSPESEPSDAPPPPSVSVSIPSIKLPREEEDEEVQKLKNEPFRPRSPPVIVGGRPGTTPPPSVEGSLYSTLPVRHRGRGQRSLVRPMMVVDQEDEVAMQERQKQQERFREAQSIQREMSQIELQYEELEEIARDVEQNLRDSEETDQEEAFMKAWLNMIQERNVLVRRTQELSLQMKVLELEDRQYELEKTMRDLQTDESMNGHQFDKLLSELVDVIDERDGIVKQVEQDRVRELEEEASQSTMMTDVFGLEPDEPSRNSRSNSTISIGKNSQKETRRTSWWRW